MNFLIQSVISILAILFLIWMGGVMLSRYPNSPWVIPFGAFIVVSLFFLEWGVIYEKDLKKYFHKILAALMFGLIAAGVVSVITFIAS